MNKYLFVGGFYPNEIIDDVIKDSKKSMQLAADNLQKLFIDGFEKNKIDLTIINKMFLSSFPLRHKKFYVKHQSFKTKYGTIINNLGFNNLFIYKDLRAKNILLRSIKKWILNLKKDDGVIIFYSSLKYHLDVIKSIKKKFKFIKICLIVPDLPKFTCYGYSKINIRNYLKTKLDKQLKNSTKYIDKFCLIAENMKNYLKIDETKCFVIEGISKNVENIEFVENNLPEKHIVYTGNLSIKYGLDNLINSFKLIDKENYRLILAGNKNSENFIDNAIKDDKRIKYLGILGPEELKKLTDSASVLVNPRTSIDIATNYMFPSKVLDYLSTGKPIISYKLGGMPVEYFEHCLILENESLINLKEELIYACELSNEKRKKIFNSNISFLNSKSAYEQCKKMIINLND